MKKKCIGILTAVSFLITALAGCGSGGGFRELTLNEATHSVFYAPFYVAIEKDYFGEEGLKIKLVYGLGTDKTKKALLEGDSDLGLLGPEAAVYLYNEGNEDYLVNFAQLTQRAGDFLVSRDKNEKFAWNNLIGRTVLGGRADGMPEMVFEYILKKNGIDSKTQVNIVENIEFGKTAQAFTSGQGDYTLEFEPEASVLELNGTGRIAASLGEESGRVPYTVFAAKRSYIEKKPEIIQSFANAVQKGLDFVLSHTPEETASVIKPQFPQTDKDTLVRIVTTYSGQDTWKNNLIFEKGSFILLEDIINEAGELTAFAPYEDIVTTEFATRAVK